MKERLPVAGPPRSFIDIVRLPTRAAAMIALAALWPLTAAGCRHSNFPDPVNDVRVSQRYVIPDPYEIMAITAGRDGLWFSTAAPKNFGTDRSGGALGHIDRHGTLTMIELPTVDSYPGSIVVDRDGTVWYELIKGHGVRQTVDTGMRLANTEGYLGWRTRDGAFHDLRLSRTRESINRLGADPAGGVWFTAAAFPDNVYGHVDTHGTLVDYGLPRPAEQCATPCPEASSGEAAGYANAIQPGPTGTVWLIVSPGCKILHLDVASGRLLHRFAGNHDPHSYLAECFSAAAAPGGSVAVPTWDGFALAQPTGAFELHTLSVSPTSPGQPEPDLRPLVTGLAIDPAGQTWTLVTDHLHAATATSLYLSDNHGRVRTFRPIPDPGPPPTNFAERATMDRNAMAQFDVGADKIASAPDGTLWLAADLTVYELTIA